MKRLFRAALVLPFAVFVCVSVSSAWPKPAPLRAASNTAVSDRGTEQQPIVVLVQPNRPTPDENEKDAYERGEKRDLDRRMTEYTGYTVAVTFLMAGIAAVQAVMFIVQLWMMGGSLRVSKLASEAAKDSADISRASMEIGQRAYVHYSGLEIMSILDESNGNLSWRFRPAWRNTGNTPTRECRIYARREIWPDGIPLDVSWDIPPEIVFSPVTVPPGEQILGDMCYFSGQQLADAQSGKARLFIWGSAEYRTVFPTSSLYSTRFCVELTTITANPTQPYDEKTNRVTIAQIIRGQHNDWG